MTVMDTGRLDRINARAADIHPVRTLLTLLAAILFGLGWAVAQVFRVLWLVGAWSAAAVMEGWAEARSAHTRGTP